MKIHVIILIMLFALLSSFHAIGSDFEDSLTPIEQSDITTLDQLDSSTESELTPIEQDDMETIDQFNESDTFPTGVGFD